MSETRQLNYGLAIRRLRDERALTLEELARAAGVSPSYLSEIERGLKRPSSDVTAKVAQAFGMSPSGFLEYVETISGRGGANAVYMMMAEEKPPAAPAAAPPAPTSQGSESPNLRLLISHARFLDESDLKTLVDLARRLLRKDKS